MRIRNKISLLYTQLTFLVLLGAFTFVFVVTAKRNDSAFYDQVWDRAMIMAQVRFERDEMTNSGYNNLREKSHFMLNDERITMLDSNVKGIYDSLRVYMRNEDEIRRVLLSETIEYKMNGRYCIAMYYPDNEGDFIIITSAIDLAGAESTWSLFELLLVILVSSTVLVYFVGLLYAKRVLAPIMVIITNVRRITANNLKRSLREERGNDELSELSRTFNNMIVRLRHAFDMQNSFIRNASHELRNPLTAILGETEIALSKPRSQQEYVATLETVLVETERLNVMIRDLLMLAQTDFDFSRIPKHIICLNDLIDEVVKTIPGANVNVSADKIFETTGVDTLLKIVFLNIIGNAIKFSSGKQVRVRMSEKMGKIVIEVVDKGIGIPPSELKHIMQPFYRANNTSSFKGTGIGLALAARIVSLHAGKLNVSSEDGEGTTVTVILDNK